MRTNLSPKMSIGKIAPLNTVIIMEMVINRLVQSVIQKVRRLMLKKRKKLSNVDKNKRRTKTKDEKGSRSRLKKGGARKMSAINSKLNTPTSSILPPKEPARRKPI
jgi:hypothetical protein